jgi:hypothetical protein
VLRSRQMIHGRPGSALQLARVSLIPPESSDWI